MHVYRPLRIGKNCHSPKQADKDDNDEDGGDDGVEDDDCWPGMGLVSSSLS